MITTTIDVVQLTDRDLKPQGLRKQLKDIDLQDCNLEARTVNGMVVLTINGQTKILKNKLFKTGVIIEI